MSRVDVVIDLETMGTSPRAAIVAIGAVALVDGEVHDEHYTRVGLDSSMAAGGEVDAGTVQWWMRQVLEARREIDGSLPNHGLAGALIDLTQWFMRLPDLKPCVWGNGASFDCVILRSAYAAVGARAPWPYWAERDLRTILDLYPAAKDQTFEGLKHHALDDARHEARMLALALSAHCARAADTALLDSGMIRTLDPDWKGNLQPCYRNGLDLRQMIGDAVEKRRSEGGSS